MINAERIEEMKQLSAEATPGPWHAKLVNGWNVDICGQGRLVIENDATLIGEDIGFIAKSRQFVPEIIAAYEFQLERLGAHGTVIKGLSEMVERRDVEIAELRRTLEYFADKSHYFFGIGGECEVLDNGRDIAEEALAWRNTTRK